jgi:hypothetical protein
VHDSFPIRPRDGWPSKLSSESILVEFDGFLTISVEPKVNSDGMHSFGDGLWSSFWHIYLHDSILMDIIAKNPAQWNLD